MQRALDGRAGGDTDHGAVAHQCGIECNGDVAPRRQLAEMRAERRVVVGQRGGKRADRKPFIQIRQIGQFGNERAIDEDQAARLDIAKHRARRFGARLGRGVRRIGERLGIAHQRAQIGIFPLLDATMRQAFFGEHIEGGVALRGDSVAPRQCLAHEREGLRQRGFRRGLDRGDFGVHAKTSS